MCEIMYPSTSRSIQVECEGSLKVKYYIKNHKSENKGQMKDPNVNGLAQNTEKINGQATVAKSAKMKNPN